MKTITAKDVKEYRENPRVYWVGSFAMHEAISYAVMVANEDDSDADIAEAANRYLES